MKVLERSWQFPRTYRPEWPQTLMTELWLLRHGETEWNADGRVQGHIDVALSPKGIGQAFRVAERLAGMKVRFDGLYSSDLERARETARPIAQALGLQLVLEPRIREIDAGRLSGLLRAETAKLFPAYHLAIQLDPWYTARPGGESMAEVAARFLDFAYSLPAGRFLLVAHGGVVRAALKSLLEMQDDSWRRFNIANTSITRLSIEDGRGSALSVGDTAHLELWADALMDDA